MAVKVELPQTGTMVVGIDTIYVQDNLDKDNWGAYADPAAARASAKKLQDIAERENAMLLYGHDPYQWETLNKAPDYYS